MSIPTNCLVLPDVHYRKKPGGQDKRTLNAIKKYASDHQWSHVVWLGDVMDNNSISDFNSNNPRKVEGETLWKDYEVANKDLDEFDQATHGAEKIVIEGNHDYRSTRVVDAQPQLAGLVETEVGLKLAERNWTWVPYWSKGTVLNLGKASFGHGRYVNLHHAYKHGIRYGRNFFYGHTHDVQSHTMERDGDDKKYEAASLGCVCEYDPEYIQGAPTKWQQAFGVFRFRPDGHFNHYVVRIFQHKFVSPEGVEYKG